MQYNVLFNWANTKHKRKSRVGHCGLCQGESGHISLKIWPLK